MKDAVDMFAGAGGFTLGAEQAGLHVYWSANHWRQAVSVHRDNHPKTFHSCQDLRQANFGELPDFKFLLASPACQGFSKARGRDKKHHDDCRSTAWAVIDCLESKRPPYGIIENVPEFAKWELFDVWKLAVEKLGYTPHVNLLDAADFGVPQHRERVFITLVHKSVGTNPIVVTPPKLPHVAAKTIIDWKGGDWSSVYDMVENTVNRFENGRKQYGVKFVMPYYGSGSGMTGRSINRPIGTITTKDRWAIVNGTKMRMFSVDECRRAMGFPEKYRLAKQKTVSIKMLGNAVVPAVAKYVIEYILGLENRRTPRRPLLAA